MILAIDPGNVVSGFVRWCPHTEHIQDMGIRENESLLPYVEALCNDCQNQLVIEIPRCYGMPVGASILDTCVWVGRFKQAAQGKSIEYGRKTIVTHLCGSSRAKDSNVRQALIDKFGEPGTKKNPGKLYGVKKDIWQALALAVFYGETEYGGEE